MVKKKNSNVPKSVVIIKKLHSLREQKTYTEYCPLDDEETREIEHGVAEIFDFFGGAALIKSSREGCVNNPLADLQTIYKDCDGRGGWTLVMGKGFADEDIRHIRGKTLLAGYCAIEELYEHLINAIGTKNLYCSGKCNDLQATAESMFHLMKVNPMKLSPINPLKALYCIIRAKLNKSHGKLVNPFAHVLKLH